MYNGYERGPICPMCNKVAVKLTPINGVLSCLPCKKKIRRNQEIVPYKATDDRNLTKVELYHREEHKKRIAERLK